MNPSILPINNTLKLLSSCWVRAEKNLQNEIKNRFPDEDEVMITKLFVANLRGIFQSENDKNAFSNAFCKDLQSAISLTNYEMDCSPQQISADLIAEVILHTPETERKTGGDLGFVIQRPNLDLSHLYSKSSYCNISLYRSGLLIQAKLKNMRGKWGRLTKNQENKLKSHEKFLALLLLSYRDSERFCLDQFKWQSCKAFEVSDMKEWLKRESFPTCVTSDRIITQLGNAEIGTDVQQEINEYISPPKNRTLSITIRKRDGKPPITSYVFLRTKSKEKSEEKQFVRLVRN